MAQRTSRGGVPMSAVRRFAIQRDDAAWYAGRSEDGTPRWADNPDQRELFQSEAEARQVLDGLQRSGYRVRLLGLFED